MIAKLPVAERRPLATDPGMAGDDGLCPGYIRGSVLDPRMSDFEQSLRDLVGEKRVVIE